MVNPNDLNNNKYASYAVIEKFANVGKYFNNVGDIASDIASSKAMRDSLAEVTSEIADDVAKKVGKNLKDILKDSSLLDSIAKKAGKNVGDIDVSDIKKYANDIADNVGDPVGDVAKKAMKNLDMDTSQFKKLADSLGETTDSLTKKMAKNIDVPDSTWKKALKKAGGFAKRNPRFTALIGFAAVSGVYALIEDKNFFEAAGSLLSGGTQWFAKNIAGPAINDVILPAIENFICGTVGQEMCDKLKEWWPKIKIVLIVLLVIFILNKLGIIKLFLIIFKRKRKPQSMPTQQMPMQQMPMQQMPMQQPMYR